MSNELRSMRTNVVLCRKDETSINTYRMPLLLAELQNYVNETFLVGQMKAVSTRETYSVQINELGAG